MKQDLLQQAANLDREIQFIEGFIKALPTTVKANALVAVQELYQDYHDIAIDYLNSDILDVLAKARRMAEAHLAQLKKQFEEL